MHPSNDAGPASGWRRAAAGGLTFRPVNDADLPFLARLFASTREQELEPVPWSPEQKAAFLDMQFRAQHTHYKAHYGDALWLVIQRDKEPIGRLYLDRGAKEHGVIDIALLPAHRGQGLGHALMSDLLEEAGAAGKPLSIYVERNNPAMRLYRRLGFITVEEGPVYDLMRWTPQPNTA